MGLAASQARFLCLTARKADCTYKSTELAQQKLSLTNKLSEASNEYSDALNSTKLCWENPSLDDAYYCNYNLLMTPSAMNDYTPYLITNTAGAVVLNSEYAKAAAAAGISKTGGTVGDLDGRNKFIESLQSDSVITQDTLEAVENTTYNQYAGMGAEPIETVVGSTMSLNDLMLSEDIGLQLIDLATMNTVLGNGTSITETQYNNAIESYNDALGYINAGSFQTGADSIISAIDEVIESNKTQISSNATNSSTLKADNVKYADYEKLLNGFSNSEITFKNNNFSILSSAYSKIADKFDEDLDTTMQSKLTGTQYVEYTKYKELAQNLANGSAVYNDKTGNFETATGTVLNGYTQSKLVYYAYDIDSTTQTEFNTSTDIYSTFKDELKTIVEKAQKNYKDQYVDTASDGSEEFKYALANSYTIGGTTYYNGRYELRQIGGNYDANGNYSKNGGYSFVETSDMESEDKRYNKIVSTLEDTVYTNQLGDTVSISGVDGSTKNKEDNQFTVIINNQIETNLDDIADISLGTLLANDVTIMVQNYDDAGSTKRDYLFGAFSTGHSSNYNTNKIGDSITADQKNTFVNTFNNSITTILDQVASILGYNQNTGVGLNVDDASAQALETAYNMTMSYILNEQKAVTAGNGAHDEDDSDLQNNDAYVASQDYNRTVIDKNSQYMSISLSNLVSSFLTYYANALEGYGTDYNVGTSAADSVYVTDDSSYMYSVSNPDAVTDMSDLNQNYFDEIYNNICEHGWVEDDTVKDAEYFQQAIKNGRYLISSLNYNDGYYYQHVYNEASSYLVEETDQDAIAVAEAKYEATKADITYKEESIDVESKNLDAEISALNTEISSVQSMLSSHITNAFKMFN